MPQQLCPLLERETEVAATAYSRSPWNIVRCRETDFVYLANPPEYDALASEFAWEKTSAAEAERRRRAEPIVSRLSLLAIRMKSRLFPRRNKMSTLVCQHLPPRQQPLRVLDIGCGRGSLLEDICRRVKLQGRQVQPVGIEVSPQMAALAADKFEQAGGRVIVSSAIDGVASLAAEQADVIVMSCFLEHERQPYRLLTQAQQALAADGVVVIKVPNFASWNRRLRGQKWCGFRYPDHVNYFTPQTLARLAEATGFYVARQQLLDKFPLSDNMYAVLQKRVQC